MEGQRPRSLMQVLMTLGYVPGVPAMGHLDAEGYWHPGARDACHKGSCEQHNKR